MDAAVLTCVTYSARGGYRSGLVGEHGEVHFCSGSQWAVRVEEYAAHVEKGVCVRDCRGHAPSALHSIRRIH